MSTAHGQEERTADAHRGLQIMRRSGEDAGRRFLLEREHPDTGPRTAQRTGTLILEDGSVVTITAEHYAFRWTQHEHEFALSHPVSEITQPWPAREDHKTLRETAIDRMLDEIHAGARADLGLAEDASTRAFGAREAREAAPDLWETALAVVRGVDASDRLSGATDRFLDECAAEIAERLPVRQRRRLEDEVTRTLKAAAEGADPDGA